MYNSYLGVAGSPIEWTDRYQLSDAPPRERNRPVDPNTAADPDAVLPAGRRSSPPPAHGPAVYR